MELKDFNIVKSYEQYKDKYRHSIQKHISICPKCKNEFVLIVRDNIINNKSGTCKGCVSRKLITEDDKRLYRIWHSIKQRTDSNKGKDFIVYKSKGIIVCNEWLQSFENFKMWALDNGYNNNLSIDRKNNNKGYNPDNCRWVTQTVQNRNQRKLRSTNTSGYRGVSFRKDTKKWSCEITVNYKKIRLGSFNCRLEASYAYDDYITKNNLEHTKNF